MRRGAALISGLELGYPADRCFQRVDRGFKASFLVGVGTLPVCVTSDDTTF